MLAAVKVTDGALDAHAAAALPAVPESALYPLHSNAEPDAVSAAGHATAEPVLPLKNFLREQEQTYLNRALQHCGGDKEKAALLLGVSLATLYRKLSGEDKES